MTAGCALHTQHTNSLGSASPAWLVWTRSNRVYAISHSELRGMPMIVTVDAFSA
jgi:hypothetical protein